MIDVSHVRRSRYCDDAGNAVATPASLSKRGADSALVYAVVRGRATRRQLAIDQDGRNALNPGRVCPFGNLASLHVVDFNIVLGACDSLYEIDGIAAGAAT